MQLISWLTPDNQLYQAKAARAVADIGVPDYPVDGKRYAFDREQMEWIEVLPTIAERIQAIQTKYQPTLANLQSAFNGAQLYGNTVDAEEIQAEYRALVTAMDQEIEEVQNG